MTKMKAQMEIERQRDTAIQIKKQNPYKILLIQENIFSNYSYIKFSTR